jgi:DNA-binding transcriptional ArsR family regulator
VIILALLGAYGFENIHVNVNIRRSVRMWQDSGVSELQPAAAEPADVRDINDVDSLRALADPTRQAILVALMQPRNGELPVMSAKELAAQLGEPQTKLYRHIRQLEAAGLIRVAATRLVSGILEQRYQAAQRDLSLSSGFLRDHTDEAEAVMQAMLNNFRDGFFTAFRDKSLAPDAVPENEAYRRPTLFAADARVSRDQAAELRSRIQDLAAWLEENAPGEKAEGVTVNVLIGYYCQPGSGAG